MYATGKDFLIYQGLDNVSGKRQSPTLYWGVSIKITFMTIPLSKGDYSLACK